MRSLTAKVSKKITIPDSVASIGDSAFEGCAAMNEVKLPKNIEIISECTFKGCGSLKEVTVPKSVTSIGEYALGYSDEWNDDENARGYKKYDGFTIKGCRGTEASVTRMTTALRLLRSTTGRIPPCTATRTATAR